MTRLLRQYDHYDSDVLYGSGASEDSSFTSKLSVIVLHFNHEKYLGLRLESLYGQSYYNFEVVFLDDYSSGKNEFYQLVICLNYKIMNK